MSIDNLFADGYAAQSKTVNKMVSDLVEGSLLDVATARQFLAADSAHRQVTYGDLKRLVDSDVVDATELAIYLGAECEMEVEPGALQKPLKSRQGLISTAFLRENRLLPCSGLAENANENEIRLLVANPFDATSINSALKALDGPAKLVLVPIDVMEILLENHLRDGKSADKSEAGEAGNVASSLDMLLDLASGTPVVAIVNEMLEQAVDLRATDIHLGPTRGDLSVRYRVDGILRQMPDRPAQHANAIVSRIKVLAKLDIAEKRIPQDGATRLNVQGSDIDLRIATLPTNHGESIVIRLLAHNASLPTLASMGMSERDNSAILRLLDQPYGMIAVTGPTGSGKTTTLATVLSRLNDTSRKIVTIEDPIEYQIENIAQSQVRPEIGSTFATAIRAFVRQDPDIIMVGEIRDGDTAKAAVQAAQTGHLLLSTLHANTAVSAIGRLRDLGIESYLLAGNLRGIIAQRLVRVLCQHCKKSQALSTKEIKADSRHALFGFVRGDTVFTASGCARCAHTGYRGRTAVFEIFEISNTIALAIGENRPFVELQRLAVKGGMTTLSEDARRLVDEGVTSTEEIFRVTAYL